MNTDRSGHERRNQNNKVVMFEIPPSDFKKRSSRSAIVDNGENLEADRFIGRRRERLQLVSGPLGILLADRSSGVARRDEAL